MPNKHYLKMRKKQIIRSSRNDVVLAPCFLPSYKYNACSIKTRDNIRATTSLTTRSLMKTNKPSYKIQEENEREKILEWLEDENAPPCDIMNRLSQTSSIYAPLYKKCAEELSFIRIRSKAQSLIDLELNASHKAATVDVEIENTRKKLKTAKEENILLKNDLIKKTKELDNVNNNFMMHEKVEKMHHILNDRELIDERATWNKRDCDFPLKTKKDNTVVSSEKYQELWEEQQEILHEIEILKAKLSETQEKQINLIKEIAKHG